MKYACMQGSCGNVPAPTEGELGLEASSAPLRPLLPGQCLLLVDTFFMRAYKKKEPLWLDGLYVRWGAPRNATLKLRGIAVNQALVWMTNVTMQGNGERGSRTPFRFVLESSAAAWIRSYLYAEGVPV